MDAAIFSELVGLIYDCAIDVALWPETLDRLRRELCFANISMSLVDVPSGRFILNLTSGISDVFRERMNDYPEDLVAMWGGMPAMLTYPMDRPTVLSRANPAVMDSDNRYVREWALPQGLIDSLVVILAHDAEAIGNFATGRHRDQGPITDHDIACMSLFIPHLQRAAKISRLLDANAAAAAGFESVIEALATPVILVAPDLWVIHANASARGMLAQGNLLARLDGQLAVRAPGAQQSLARLVAAACADESGLTGGGIGLPVGADDTEVSALYILPLARGGLRPGLRRGAAAAIFVSPASAAPGRTGEVLATLFGLTKAETRVFLQIAAGRTSLEAAGALGIAPSTVKTHLLRLYGKTGARRQADLVRLAAALAPPIGAGFGPGPEGA